MDRLLNLQQVRTNQLKRGLILFQQINDLMVKNNKKSQSSHEIQQIKSTQAPSRDQKEYIGHFDEAPQILKDNEHILKGYRLNHDNPKSIFKSLFVAHNQTVNIWTHLIGAIIVFFFIFQGIAYQMEESHVLGKALIKDFVMPYAANQPILAQQFDPKQLCELLNQDLKEGQPLYQCQATNKNQRQSSLSNNEDLATWPIMVGLLGGAICLACSTTYHLIHPMNEKIYNLALSLDFAGIGINMAFSPVPAFYYSFYCSKFSGTIYITLVVIAGTLSFVTSLIDWFKRKENLIYKIAILIVSSLVCVTGLVHLTINEFVYGNYGDKYSIVPSLYMNLSVLVSYGIGFIFYLRKCPQRYRPGHFDICGHSHQIWHVFVFIAIVLTYLGALACYEVRSQWPVCPLNSQSSFQL